MAEMTALEWCRARLGPVDELNIHLLLRVYPAQRLRKAHPDLSDCQICLRMFQHLKQNDAP